MQRQHSWHLWRPTELASVDAEIGEYGAERRAAKGAPTVPPLAGLKVGAIT